MSDTRMALLTPPGKAAIATLAIHGPRAWELTRAALQTARPLPDAPTPGRIYFGQLGDVLRDEVLVAVKRADCVEIHTHGGPEVVRMVQETFAAHGVIAVPWQAFCEAAAFELLVHAPTFRTAAILLDQYRGAFEQAFERALGDDSLAGMRRLAELAPVGRHLVPPWCVVVGGAPNAGKSSLLNAIAGFTRSVVSPTPGTTRDLVTVQVALDGWPVELIDTAGLRDAPGALERAGVDRAHQAAADADLRLWVVDAVEPVLPPAGDWRIVLNKIDLASPADMRADARVSALTGEGVSTLCQTLADWLVPSPPLPGEGVPFTEELAEAVRRHA